MSSEDWNNNFKLPGYSGYGSNFDQNSDSNNSFPLNQFDVYSAPSTGSNYSNSAEEQQNSTDSGASSRGDNRRPQFLSRTSSPILSREGSSSDCAVIKTPLERKPRPVYSIMASVNFKDLVFTKKIGEGGFGEVWLGEWRGQSVAIKNLKLGATSVELEDELKREANIMKNLKNPTIVTFYGLCLGDTKCIVIEYMTKGSLNSVLNKKSPETFSWQKKYIIAKDIAEGLFYLHRQNPQIIHRDLKSHNVLLTDNYRAKLADFGLAYEKIKTETMAKTPLSNQSDAMRGVGTLCWMAPELFSLSPKYSTASDIYAYGIMLWEMATHKIPYAGVNPSVLQNAIKKGERVEIPEEIPEKVYSNMIERCWAQTAAERPTTDELKKLLEGLISKPSKKPPSRTKQRIPDKKAEQKNIIPNRTSNSSGNSRSEPKNLPSLPPPKKLPEIKMKEEWVAIYDYHNAEKGYLSFKAGETINILEKTGAWWKGEIKGNIGLIPFDFIQLKDKKEAAKLPATLALPIAPKASIIIPKVQAELPLAQKVTGTPHTRYKTQKQLPPKYECDRTLQGHSNAVNSVAVLPNGNVISGSWDKTLKAWDMATGQCLSTLQGHSKGVSCVAVQPNGNVISGSDDNTLKVWDIATGQCLNTLQGHSRKVNCVAVLSNGNVISGSDDKTLKLWDIATGECVRTLQGHVDTVYCVAVLPNGYVISGSYKEIKVWDIAAGTCLNTLQGHSNTVTCVAILPNGNVISGSWDKTLKVWDIATGECVNTLQGHSNSVYCVAWLPNGHVISGSDDNTLKVWDILTGQCLNTLNEHKLSVECVAVLPNGNVISGSADKTLKIRVDKNALELNVEKEPEAKPSRELKLDTQLKEAQKQSESSPQKSMTVEQGIFDDFVLKPLPATQNKQPSDGSCLEHIPKSIDPIACETMKIVALECSGRKNIAALTTRFMHGTFVEEHDLTNEDSYRKLVEYKNQQYMLEILDNAGSAQFTAMRDFYIKNGQVFILVFSLTAPYTFNGMPDLREQVLRVMDIKNVPMVLVGTKCDLINQRVITREQGEALANKFKIPYLEVSAKTGMNVEKIFFTAIEEMLKYKTENEQVTNAKIAKINTKKSGQKFDIGKLSVFKPAQKPDINSTKLLKVSKDGTTQKDLSSSGAAQEPTKIMVLGSQGTDKRALIVQFVHGIFMEKYDPTIDDSYRKLVVCNNQEYMLEILDMTGLEKNTAMRDLYMENADAFILVFSLMAQSTFDDISDWREQILRFKGVEQFPMVLVGNKCDLADHRVIMREQGEALANKFKIPYLEASARIKINVEEVFYTAIEEMLKYKNANVHTKKATQKPSKEKFLMFNHKKSAKPILISKPEERPDQNYSVANHIKQAQQAQQQQDYPMATQAIKQAVHQYVNDWVKIDLKKTFPIKTTNKKLIGANMAKRLKYRDPELKEIKLSEESEWTSKSHKELIENPLVWKLEFVSSPERVTNQLKPYLNKNSALCELNASSKRSWQRPMKVGILGSGDTDKGALETQFLYGIFVEKYNPAIEYTDRKLVEVDGDQYMIEILNTAGSEQFSTMRDLYMKNGDAFVLVYSIIAQSTFVDLLDLREQLLRVRDVEKVPMILVGTKCHLADQRVITTDQGEALASKFGCKFLEVSTETHVNVEQIFYDLVRQYKLYKGKKTDLFHYVYEKIPLDVESEKWLEKNRELNKKLYQAVIQNDKITVQQLLQKRVSPVAPCQDQTISKQTLLDIAAEQGDVDMLAILLNQYSQYGFSIDTLPLDYQFKETLNKLVNSPIFPKNTGLDSLPLSNFIWLLTLVWRNAVSKLLSSLSLSLEVILSELSITAEQKNYLLKHWLSGAEDLSEGQRNDLFKSWISQEQSAKTLSNVGMKGETSTKEENNNVEFMKKTPEFNLLEEQNRTFETINRQSMQNAQALSPAGSNSIQNPNLFFAQSVPIAVTAPINPNSPTTRAGGRGVGSVSPLINSTSPLLSGRGGYGRGTPTFAVNPNTPQQEIRVPPKYECQRALQGHSNQVRSVVGLPNGHVISGSSDNTLKVWDIATGQCLSTLEGHSSWVNCVAVLPNGHLISGSTDKTLKVWDNVIGQFMSTLQGHSDTVSCVAVLPSGNVISGSWDKMLKVWDIATGTCLNTLQGHSNTVTCVAVLPDGHVISGSWDKTLKVWDIGTGQCMTTLQGHSDFVMSIAWLPNGQVISGSMDKTLKVWDITTGKCISTLQGHNNFVNCVAVLPNGHVISGSEDNTLKVWDITTGQCMSTLQGQSFSALSVAVLPNGNVISGARGGDMSVWADKNVLELDVKPSFKK